MTAAFDWLQAMVIASLAGSAAGGVLWLWFRCMKRTSPAAQYLLWFAALLVCVLPIRIAWQSPPSEMPLQEITVYITETVTRPLPPSQTAGVPQVAWGDVFAAVWLAVAGALYLWQVVRHALSAWRLRRTTVAVECPLLSEFTRRQVRVRAGETVSSPLLVGVFRPTLYLPACPLDEVQLRHVLAHETVHLHRGDLWLKQVAVAVRCLCWFNPAVYGIYRRFNALCEISCDVAAVRKTGGDAAAYLATVLQLMCTGQGGALTTAMASDPRRVKERFAAVRAFRPHRLVTVLAVTAAVVVLTGAVCAGGVVAGRETAPATVPTLPQVTFPNVKVEDVSDENGAGDGWHWPLRQKESAVTATFGYRWGKLHCGIDIAAAEGESVVAAAAGKVIVCEEQGYNGGYGRTVLIDHGNGRSTLYAHLDRIAVEVGDYVEARQILGTVGITGNVTGPCLHFEVRQDDEAVDPLPYLGGLSLVEEGEYPVYWTEYVDEEISEAEIVVDREENTDVK